MGKAKLMRHFDSIEGGKPIIALITGKDLV